MITSITMAGFSAAVGNVRTGAAGQEQGAGREVVGAGDRVTISEAGRTVSALTGKITNGGTISLASFADQFREDTRLVEEKLQGLYRKLGINSDMEMNLSVGYDGKILANGEGGKVQEFAEAVNADEELANTFRRMSATAALLEAARKHQEFAEAYAQNPQQAVERFGYLLEDGHEYQVNFAYGNGQLDASVAYV